MEFYQNLSDLGEEKYPTPAHSSHLVPSKRGEKRRSTRSTLAKSLGANHRAAERSPSPTLYHCVIKGLFIVVPLTHHIMSTFQQKITRHIKRLKRQFEQT